ncbi:hypothetical protein H072_448 [Dactylellina haptotyla CBS 200.50]|uniref:Carboxylic ester hydrolase n=1 Tax=Dactylellina haptotyla (strain CBS 200.50) TaxID=1284197 RepID=S8ART1_DACHA|nr:hypothetical protein H072_448 [Dactylellina haptotyla CBS 200.50]
MKLARRYAILGALATVGSSFVSADNINPSKAFSIRCSNLPKSFQPDQKTTVLLAEFLPKGSTIINPSSLPECAITNTTILADICRLRLNVTTSSTSSTVMEAWMPADWSVKGRRFLMTGNGGLAGCIGFDDLNYYTSLGFATAGHNNGHEGNTGLPFYNRPEVLKDYVFRALLTATHVGKKAATHLYQQVVKNSYYIGCSTGGRQGLKAAQDFPEEFDGIIAGAPAHNWNNLMSAFAYYWKYVANQQNPLVMTADQWVAWRDEVIHQCDTIDGVADLVIEDPRKCRPRPEARLCAPGQTWNSNKCFTSYQVTFLRKLYEPFYGNNGTWLYPGFAPGDETITSFWIQAAPPQLPIDWYRYAVLSDPNWTIEKDFDLDTADYNNAVDAFNISTYKDLSKLKASGHKLIQYHGLADGSLTYEGSDLYYESNVRRLGLPSAQMDKFYRYFPISGLSHCATGKGAWFIGAANQFFNSPASPAGITGFDPAGGVVMSMVKWVEEGIAPETILGRGVGADGKATSTKDHCKYPKKSTYVGGDASKRTSWRCL